MTPMDDVIFLAVFVVMVALAYGYVRVCDRIVRSDDAGNREVS